MGTTSRNRTEGVGPGTRAVSPVVGVVLLIAITVVLATTIAVAAGTLSVADPAPTASFDLTVDGERSTVSVEHVAGDPIDVDDLAVTIDVEGTSLAEQPPVPFVGASGFDGAPSGPFNPESDQEWTVGERATLAVATTNEPTIQTGDTVTVTLAVDDRRVATLEATA